MFGMVSDSVRYSAKIREMSFSSILWHCFSQTYLRDVDGYDAIEVEKNPSIQAQYKAFATHKLTILARLLGLPHRLLAGEKTQSRLNLLKNFGSYRNNRSWWMNGPVLAIMVPLNIVTTIINFLINVAMLVTELLPYMLKMLFYKAHLQAANYAKEKFWQKDYMLMLGGILLTLLFAVGASAFFILHHLGMAITSPALNVRTNWQAGCDFGKHYFHSAKIGYVFGFICAGIAVINTAAMYAVLFPLTMKAVPVGTFPFIAQYLPGVLKVILHIASIPFSLLGKATIPLLNFYIAPAFANLSSLFVGLGAALGFSLATVGPVAQRWSHEFRTWWHAVPTERRIGLLDDLGASEVLEGSRTANIAHVVGGVGVAPEQIIEPAVASAVQDGIHTVRTGQDNVLNMHAAGFAPPSAAAPSLR